MRRVVTSLLVATVATIGALAAFEVLGEAPHDGIPAARDAPQRSGDPDRYAEPLGGARRFVALEDRPPPTELSERSFAAGLLDGAGLSGRIYLSDERCRLRGYHLPTLDLQRLPDLRACSFSLSDDGWLARGIAVWQPRGSLAAVCRGGIVEIVTRSGEGYDRVPGCAPAWRPDGSLTYVRDGAVRSWPAGAEIVSGGELVQALQTAPWPARSAAVEEILWLPTGRLVAVVRQMLSVETAGEDLVVSYDPQHGTAALVARAPRITELAASPAGSHIAVRFDGAVHVLPAGPLPGGHLTLRPADAFAWSPDGRWLAVAANARLIFVPVRGQSSRRPSIGPIAARDLAWRAG